MPERAARQLDLGGEWRLTFAAQDRLPAPDDAALPADAPTIAASVPGNVELDLAAAGYLPAPLERGEHAYAAAAYELHGWWYEREFEFDTVPETDAAWLVFEGLDCLGSVFLNGVFLGRAENMLIAHEFDASAALRPGRNRLLVRIDSAVLAGRAADLPPICYAMTSNWESLAVRKAPHMYGWDILPRLVSAGIYRPVRLELRARAEPRLEVYWRTLRVDPAAPSAELAVDYQLLGEAPATWGPYWSVEVNVTRAGEAEVAARSVQPLRAGHGRQRLWLSEAALWWPRGWGEAALYEAAVIVRDGSGVVRAEHRCRVGARTVELRRTEVTDAEGSGEFLFVVNGEPLFARGTNWVPLDALHSRDPQHLPVALGRLAAVGANMVRCWGGNLYEEDAFFDGCDEAGVLVWQDFSFACASYPDDAASLAVYAAEAAAVVKRLRNHACLALWAGNNEIDQLFFGGWGGDRSDPNADPISRGVLPEVCRRHDPARGYLPSSPYYGPALVATGDARRAPEDHLWGPRDDFKGAYYTTSPAHFVSEIGYHGCPARASLEAMFDPEHLWPPHDNPQWLAKAVRPSADIDQYDYRIPLMFKQITVLFDHEPTQLDDFILASQISQAEALKFFVERWRMGKWRRTGMLWWNLRDGWPVLSDAVIDYYDRPKLAYHVLCRLQANLLICCGEPDDTGEQTVWACNDALTPHAGTLTIDDLATGARLLTTDFDAPANASTPLTTLPASTTATVWHLRWETGDLTATNHYLAGPRPFDLATVAAWLAAAGLAVEESVRG